MTTIDAPRIQSTSNLTDDTVAHGAHVRCQLDQPYVVALCGARLAWEDEQDATPEVCVVCRDLSTCPICGIHLEMPE